MRPLTRRIGALAGSLALVLGVAAPSGAVDPLPVPNAIYALGDSITVAYDVNRLLVEEPAYSWSTGTVASVESLYTRLEAKDPSAVTIKKENVAKSGAKMLDLAGQVANAKVAVTSGAELVTILMGANDACTKTEGGMTPLDTFTTQVGTALANLESKGVDQIVVASIPNIYQLWDVGRKSSTARFVWSLYGICQSMLANPSSTKQADMDRRYRVRDRVIAFNSALRTACEAIEKSDAPTRCRFDGNAVFNTPFALSDISRADYFHPSAAGQKKLASVVYTAVGLP